MTMHYLDVEPARIRGYFNAAFAPLLTIDPGDTVIYRTFEGGWGRPAERLFGLPRPEFSAEERRGGGHPLSGPIAIRGAEPGDVLEIEIGEIRPGRWGWTWAGPMTHRERRYIDLAEETTIGWTLDPDAGTATDTQELGITIPLHPFMGVMGNAPAEPGNHSTQPPRRVGGNLDCRELITGSTLWLPIEVEGALFSVGDGHGTQGDGEVSSTAIECPMERVELTFRVRKDQTLMPRAQTPAGFITFGLGDTIDVAAEQALAGMLDYLQEEYDLKRPEAAVLASLAVDLRITQVVNATVGVHAVLPPKRFTIAGK